MKTIWNWSNIKILIFWTIMCMIVSVFFFSRFPEPFSWLISALSGSITFNFVHKKYPIFHFEWR
jgi:ABC-type transport system involved in multi-copper enzyme maturation permease subunit